jgi:hypothetical protein
MKTARTDLSRVSFHEHKATINSHLSLQHALTGMKTRSLASE